MNENGTYSKLKTEKSCFSTCENYSWNGGVCSDDFICLELGMEICSEGDEYVSVFFLYSDFWYILLITCILFLGAILDHAGFTIQFTLV